jgi:hypothetical protein
VPGAGDIGVAESRDAGASWRYLGLALDEPWHLSYPFIFQWQGQAYMVPEGYGSGALRLYKAVEFPLRWEFAAVLVDRPLIDTSLVEWEGRWWMFTSDAVSTVCTDCLDGEACEPSCTWMEGLGVCLNCAPL